ncbi:AAA family ATPase [Pseudomonas sp. PP3]|uniref:trifunctional serine/threonine-protein kinase/ATP-binding protein/sensor histidine kinase n=1 Tax=Pseudomonas sp. PP3 TaxID=2815936 RepID=UPI001BAF7D7E|nr:AAA family ATPase [Pseudomonas sp. PP3]
MQTLWDDGERVLSRGDLPGRHDGASFLIVRAGGDQPSPESLDRLKHEFSLRDELEDAWAVRPLELLREHGRTSLVLVDHGGEPLARLLTEPMQVPEFLHQATKIASAVAGLHQRGIIHKDLKPAHIIVHCEDGLARLTGFGLASQLPRERLPPEIVAGTLAYMAPEQTGRMNRSIDSRSDLYSLGVMFYQMLTGSLPFAASDPMEWIHCHVAKQAVPPSVRVATVPGMLGAMVMKLLAKTAEERYQSAASLEVDLRRCLAQWQSDGRISEFTLNEYCTSDSLLIAEHLYGRESEVGVLISAFDRVVSNGTPEVVLICGYSGIGKSSVVNELRKALVPSRGLFAFGKFDQYKRDIPYSTLVQAFQRLVRSLLGKSDTELTQWRDALQTGLQPEARLITDLIPELKLIIGEPPLVPDLEPLQAQRRFLLVFRRFIGVFARAEHPLALFLDDLQWLDAATLDLLEDLVTGSDLNHLMLIGAYRDNEVDATHPLTGRLGRMRGMGARINEVTLVPLSEASIVGLIADSLRCDAAHVEPLARLVLGRTAGNPFFVIQFLQTLAEEGLLAFDPVVRQWQWDPDRIHAKGYTDNIVDLLVARLARLPSATQQALQQMACLGNASGVSKLAIVLDIPEAQVPGVLWEAIRQELVERQGDAYAFVHDRVQEAAYSLIPEHLRPVTHLRIGRLLLAQTPGHQQEEAVFEIVSQLDRGACLITDQHEREGLAHLNLVAGQRARASTAYASALNYLREGEQLLGEDDWSRQRDLSFALALNRSACEFLTGQHSIAEERLMALSKRDLTALEWSSVACLQVDLYLVLDQRDHAVAACLAFLRHVGIDWSSHPGDDEVRREYDLIETRLGNRSVEELIDLPHMQDPVALATLEALTTLFSPALHTDANLACLTICKAINLSIEFGNGDASCVAYANIPRVAGRRFGDYAAGFQFGQLGCNLVQRRGLDRFYPRTYLSYALFVERWTHPVRTSRATLDRVFEAANRIGDIPFGAFACNSLYSNMLFTGEPLTALQGEAERGLAYSRKVQFGLVTDFIENQLALIRTLRGFTAEFGTLEDELFSESDFERRLPSISRVLACWYWIRKLQARYLAGDYDRARHAAAEAQTLLWTSHSFIEEAEYHFYNALTHAASSDSDSAEDIARTLEAMADDYRQLEIWTQQCAENFSCRVALVGAEMARLAGRILQAEELYDRAIAMAQNCDVIHVEALANELASRFYASRGFAKIGRVYLQDARYGYWRWGAHGKVRHLEALYPFQRPEDRTIGTDATMATPVEHLDLATVLKVSQAVSSDLVLEKLIDMVMTTAIEQAGAQRGLLILEEAGAHRIVAQASTDDNETRRSDILVAAALLPESVLNHVLRSREIVVLDEASTESPFAGDPFIHQHRVRSLLCMPLMNRTRVTGALYLENNLTAGVFSPARIAVLKVVTSQAAISLENARLYRDVAEREAKIRRLVDANIIGIIVGTPDGDIIEANDAFLRMVGYDREDLESGQVRWRDMTPPELREDSERAMAEAFESGRASLLEKQYFRKDGTRVPVMVGLAMFEGRRREGIAFVLDLTERKQAEQQARDSEQRYRDVQAELSHANRVATMGQLTASIAHEVSQPIAATLMNAHAALRWLNMQPPEFGEVRQALDSLVKQSNRAADVLGRIRGHIRNAPAQKEPMDINAMIREMVEFTRSQVAKCGATLQTQLADGLPLVEGDRVELQQVLLNLMINALEAMGAVSDGVRQLRIRSMLNDAGWVRVCVSDSGPGFTGGDGEHVFASFYTTKSAGLGLGLSICRSIVEAHGGKLWACANQPRGAIFQFSLPAAG